MPADDVNPYASPAALPDFEPKVPYGIWRDGVHLVIERGGQMPPLCVKTGEPAEHWVRCRLISSPTGSYYGVLAVLSPLVLTLVVLFASKTASIEVGLCGEQYVRRRRRQIIGWSLAVITVLGSLAGFAVSIGPPENVPLAMTTLLGGMTLGTLSLILLLSNKLVDVKEITQEYLWFTGVDSSVLARFPDFASRNAPVGVPKPAIAIGTKQTEIYRDGWMLVLKHGAIFPPVCVATGKPADAKLVVSYFQGGSRYVQEFGLTAERANERSRYLLLVWISLFMPVVAVAGGLIVSALNQGQNKELAEGAQMFGLFIAPWLLIVPLALWGKTRILTVKKVTSDRVWIIGFGSPVLEMFPELSPSQVLPGENP